MSVVVRQPTSNQTPDATLGGLAVTSISNTGHASTVTNSAANAGTASDADERSARWFGLANVGGQRTDVRLKLSWQASGQCDAADDGAGGSAGSDASWSLEYSLNGGSSWTGITSNSIFAASPGPASASFTNNNSANISLPATQDVSQIQVRVDYNTDANRSAVGNDASSSVTATVSGIQVEVTIVDPSPTVIM